MRGFEGPWATGYLRSRLLEEAFGFIKASPLKQRPLIRRRTSVEDYTVLTWRLRDGGALCCLVRSRMQCRQGIIIILGLFRCLTCRIVAGLSIPQHTIPQQVVELDRISFREVMAAINEGLVGQLFTRGRAREGTPPVKRHGITFL